jgi:glutathione S-transferase
MPPTLPLTSADDAVEIVGRRSSLFTRVALMFAETLRVPVKLRPVPDLASLDAIDYAGNPGLKIPVLRMASHTVFGTENICRALAATAVRTRSVNVVWTEDLPDALSCNGQELVWHCAAAQVQLVMGTVIAGLSAESAFFVKVRTSLEGSLAWLESNVEPIIASLPASRDASLFEISLFCLLEHLVFRPTVPLADYPKLAGFAAEFRTREAAGSSSYRFE